MSDCMEKIPDVPDRFKQEFAAYLKRRDSYVQRGLEGQYAVFKGEKELGIGKTLEEAVEIGVRGAHGQQYFLRQIACTEVVEVLSHIVYYEDVGSSESTTAVRDR